MCRNEGSSRPADGCPGPVRPRRFRPYQDPPSIRGVLGYRARRAERADVVRVRSRRRARFVLGLMGWMLDGLDDTGRKRALDALRATVTAHASSDGISFASGAWLIRAVRAAAAEGSSWTACRAAVGRGPGLALTADR